MSESVFLRVSSIQSCLVTLLRLTLCDPVDCIPSGSSVHKIFSGKIAGMDCHFFLQGGSSQPRDQTRISCVSCISWSGAGAGSLPAEPSGKPRLKVLCCLYLGAQGLVLQSRETQTSDWRPAGRPAIWREHGEEAARTAWAGRTCLQVPS